MPVDDSQEKGPKLEGFLEQFSLDQLKQEVADKDNEHFVGISPDHGELGFNPTEEEIEMAVKNVIAKKETT